MFVVGLGRVVRVAVVPVAFVVIEIKGSSFVVWSFVIVKVRPGARVVVVGRGAMVVGGSEKGRPRVVGVVFIVGLGRVVTVAFGVG